MMEAVRAFSTHPSPAGRPQPLAVRSGILWAGCWETSRLYAIDPKTWETVDEMALPGKPYGLASFDGALHVVVSIGEDDRRYVYRATPGKPLVDSDRFACPDFNGSHLTSDGTSLYLVAQTTQKIFELAKDGTVVRVVDLPTRCAGTAFDGATLYVIVADDEFDVLELATLDLTTRDLVKLAPMDVEARGLAFDGRTWYTSLRERNEIASFSI